MGSHQLIQPDRNAERGKHHPLTHHQPHDLFARCPKRDAHSELLRPLADRLRDHAVEPRQRQQ